MTEVYTLSDYVKYPEKESKIIPGKKWTDRDDAILSCPSCGSKSKCPKHGEKITCRCGLNMKVLGNSLTISFDSIK